MSISGHRGVFYRKFMSTVGHYQRVQTGMGKPKTDRKKLIDKLDTLWSKRVMERDFYRCQYCFRAGTDPHHIFSRKNLSTRWDINNGICLCRECHDDAHRTPKTFHIYLATFFPIYMELQEKAKVVVHYKNADLLEILEKIKNGG
jgi:hypothetical protein